MSEHHELIDEHRSAAEPAVPTAIDDRGEPVVAEPVVAEPVVAEPVVAEPVVAEPVVAEPVVAVPIGAEPIVAESRSGDRSGSSSDLDRIAQLPLRDQPAAYQEIHDDLRRALAEIDEA